MSAGTARVEFRPLRADDADAVQDLHEAAMEPPPGGWDADARARQGRRVAYALRGDGPGAWVAEADGELAGVGMAVRADGIWVLSLLAVGPEHQGRGVGRALFTRCLDHAEGCRGAMIASAERPDAMRLYASGGFTLRPTLEAWGTVDRAALPSGLPVRDGGSDDLALAAEVDRRVRGGARTEHLEQLMVAGARLYVADDGPRRGYAIGRDDGAVVVSALDPETAQALLWRLLADARPGVSAYVMWMTAEQDWAVRVCLAARLSLKPAGPICTRGELGPLCPYLPSGSYL